MGLMHDSLVRTTLVDNSIAIPTPDPIQTGFTFLQPFFAKRGRQNEIIRKGGIGAFEREYGNDVDNVTKYGHGGLIAKAVLQGGGIVDACRLMPDDATKSGLVISLILDENGTDPKITIHAGAVDSTKTTAVNLVKDDAFKLVAADTTTVKRYPIILLESTSTGSFGNSFTAKLSLDTTRDGKNPDGRRYVLDLADAGNRIGDKFEVISFSFNPDAKTTPSSEALDSFVLRILKHFLQISKQIMKQQYMKQLELQMKNLMLLKNGCLTLLLVQFSMKKMITLDLILLHFLLNLRSLVEMMPGYSIMMRRDRSSDLIFL